MDIDKIIEEAIKEDIGSGDHTSLATIPENVHGKARLLIKEKGILSGIDVAARVFKKIDPDILFEKKTNDGREVGPGDIAFTVAGHPGTMLSAERLALNFMQRMSGIATHTRRMVDLIEGTGAKILDTRKTTPNMRALEKMAVRTGGGFNHRMGLFDMIMIKDNHVDFAGGISNAIDAAHRYLMKKKMDLPVTIEVRNSRELEEVLKHGGVNRIMLDNFTPAELAKAVERIGHKFETEASGGIHADNILQYARTGVDYISVGALTHHIKSLDMSMKAIPS